MLTKPITRLEWWIGILLVLTALAVHGMSVKREIKKIEAMHEPRVRPAVSAHASPDSPYFK